MLENLYKKGIVYDCEIFKNIFMVSFYSKKAKKYISYSIFPPYYDQREEIIKLMESDRIFIGFNNWYFDDGLMVELIHNIDMPAVQLTRHLFDFGQRLITERHNPHKHAYLFKSYDMLEVIREGFSVKSLKGVGINLCHDKIQDLPLPIDKEVSYSDFKELKNYNFNDLVITDKIFEHVKDRLKMREGLAKEYKLPAILSASDSAIAKKLLNKFYVEKLLEKRPNTNLKQFKSGRTIRGDIDMKDIIYDKIKFTTPILQEYLTHLKTLTITLTESTPTSDTYKCDIPQLKYGGNTYTIGLGGIHSEDPPGIFEAKDGMVLLDNDVASQYPSAMINNHVCPDHLDKEIFTPLLKEIVDRRLEYKKRKTEEPRFKVLEAGLKISINCLYGLLNSKTFWVFDPKCTFEVTINNQLSILILIEKLVEANYNVISANTDGVLSYVKGTELSNIRSICKQWEIDFSFKLEEAFYSLYVRRDINNFICKSTTGEIKKKGLFIPQGGILKGYSFPLVAIALQRYFLDNVSIENTINNHTNIYDFCGSKKVGGQFHNIIEKVERFSMGRSYKSNKEFVNPQLIDKILESNNIQKTLRFYICQPDFEKNYNGGNKVSIGNVLKKVKLNNNEEQKFEYVAGYFSCLFNDYVEVAEFQEYKIDYSFYIDKCQKEIDKIECRDSKKVDSSVVQLSLFGEVA